MTLTARRHAIIEKIFERCTLAPLDDWHREHNKNPCRIWQGPDSGSGRGGGYPRMWLDGAVVAVHRVVATHFFGFIPPKKQVDHECKNRLCLEWTHFDIVTNRENCRRRDGHKPRRRKGRRK